MSSTGIVPVGRPTKYQPIFARLAKPMCALGATDLELATVCDVSLRTIKGWKVTIPEFAEAVQLGKEVADDRVEMSLYERATGYSYDSEKIVSSGGQVFRMPTVEHEAPDVNAAVWWLSNLRPKEWRLSPIVDAPLSESRVDLLAQIAADALRFCPYEPMPDNPIV